MDPQSAEIHRLNQTKMKHLITSLAFAAAFAVNAQDLAIEYPYNPDVDVDESIGVTDLMGLLGGFGEAFSPEAIMVNSVELSVFLLEMQGTMLAMQSQIESLQNTVDSLEAELVPGLANYMSIDPEAHTVLISGANFHLNNGGGSSYTTNGLGNLIVGYNEDSPNLELQRSGSHNLIMGATNDYTGASSIVTGQSNKMYATEAIVTGANNVVSGIRSAVIGGNNNSAGGEMCVVIGGQSNDAIGSSAAIIGGNDNTASGVHSVVAGGALNTAAGSWDAVFGGELSTTTGLKSVVSGGYNNTAEASHSVIYGGNNNLVHSTAASYDGYGVFGGKENEVFNGYIYGGRSNVNDGQENVIVGGHHNELLFSIDENGDGVYNRWSVIVGGINNQLPADAPDYTTVIGLWNRSFVGRQHYLNTSSEDRHIQVGPVND